jgi:DNA-binding transcriptional LysR family regulator
MDFSELDLNSLPVFLMVVEHSSLSGAARALGVPKSSVSRAISGLEAALKTRLIVRTSRHICITDEGRSFHAQCQRVLAELKAIHNQLGDAGAVPQGRLRVSLTFGFGSEVLSETLVRFVERYPQVELSLHTTNELSNLVGEEIDVALRIGKLSDSSMIVQRLGVTRGVWVTSPEYLAQIEMPTTLEDLGPHVKVSMRRPGGESNAIMEASKGSVRLSKVRISSNDPVSLRNMVIAGMGAALLPTLLCGGALREGKLVRLLPDHLSAPVVISAVYPSHHVRSVKVRSLLDSISEDLSRDEEFWSA